MDRSSYYINPVHIPIELIDGVNHTMHQDEFKIYVNNTKFKDGQKQLLERSVIEEIPIKVMGIYNPDTKWYADKHGYTINSSIERPLSRKKLFNKYRPVFYLCEKNKISEIWIIVFPSKEYIEQYAELVLSYCSFYSQDNGFRNLNLSNLINCYYFPDLESNFNKWSHLNDGLDRFVTVNDIVVLGHVEEIKDTLITLKFHFENAPFSFGIDNIFTIYCLINTNINRRVVLIGFEHSFWGSVSGRIVNEIVKKQIKAIFYIAKAGNLIDENRIHKPIIPSEFYLLKRISASTPWNWDKYYVPSFNELEPSLSILDEYYAGIHITVPTVMSETFKQADEYRNLGPTSIDNEIGHMAYYINLYNNLGKNSNDFKSTYLLCFHFVTDFLHRPYINIESSKGLGRNYDDPKTKEENRSKMDKFFQKAGRVLQLFLFTHGSPYDKSVVPNIISEHRNLIMQLIQGIPSGSLEFDPKLIIDINLDAQEYLNYGKYQYAIDIILNNRDFTTLSVSERISYIIILQKYGLIVKGRQVWNNTIVEKKDIISEVERIKLLVLDFKLRSQEKDFDNLEKDVIDLYNYLYNTSLHFFIPAILHRAAIASAYKNDLENSLYYLDLSQLHSKELNKHAFYTATLFRILVLLNLDKKFLPDSYHEIMLEIQLNYVIENTEARLWQVNKLKSIVGSFYIESAMYYKSNKGLSCKLLLLANHFMQYCGCNSKAEAFAELINMITDKDQKDLFIYFMTEIPISRNEKISKYILPDQFMTITKILLKYSSIDTKDDLLSIKKAIYSEL